MQHGAIECIVAPLRTYGGVVFEGCDTPHDELLALVWGPRFDRAHAYGLLARKPGYVPQVLQAVVNAADAFDSLAYAEQQRLRALIWRHRSRWDNAPVAH
jgi:hypothetical protein